MVHTTSDSKWEEMVYKFLTGTKNLDRIWFSKPLKGNGLQRHWHLIVSGTMYWQKIVNKTLYMRWFLESLTGSGIYNHWQTMVYMASDRKWYTETSAGNGWANPPQEQFNGPSKAMKFVIGILFSESGSALTIFWYMYVTTALPVNYLCIANFVGHIPNKYADGFRFARLN